MKKVKIRIIDKHGKGFCPRGHKIKDEFFTDGKTPEGLCCSAFNSIWPYAKMLLDTQDEKFEGTVTCPDGDVILEYELKLVNKK